MIKYIPNILFSLFCLVCSANQRKVIEKSLPIKIPHGAKNVEVYVLFMSTGTLFVGPTGENYMVWTCLSISHLCIDQVREVVAEERGRVD